MFYKKKKKNIPNPKEQVKISQYADNSNFFLRNEESVKKALTFFQNLNKATVEQL